MFILACNWIHLRGRGGRIDCLPLAWKAATRTEPGRESLAKAFCLEMTDFGLLMAGKLDVSFVEKVRFDAAAQVWRSIVGRTIDAMLTCDNPSFRNGV